MWGNLQKRSLQSLQNLFVSIFVYFFYRSDGFKREEEGFELGSTLPFGRGLNCNVIFTSKYWSNCGKNPIMTKSDGFTPFNSPLDIKVMNKKFCTSKKFLQNKPFIKNPVIQFETFGK